MIALFYTQLEAVEFSNDIHEYLKANRAGYNAVKWSELNKCDTADKWAVKIPQDFTVPATIETVNQLPENWKIQPEL